MVRFKLFLLFTILFISCGESQDFHKSSTNGNLCIENKVQSFGKVNKNKVKEIRCLFPINNYGDSSITINKIDVSCGCISTEITSNIILPHEQQILTVKINTSNRLGYMNKAVFIKSNAQNSMEIIRVKGHIIN